MTDLLHRLEAAEFAIAGLSIYVKASLVKAAQEHKADPIEQMKPLLAAEMILEAALLNARHNVEKALSEAEAVKDEKISERVAAELGRILDGLFRILAQDHLINEAITSFSLLPTETRQRLAKDLKISI